MFIIINCICPLSSDKSFTGILCGDAHQWNGVMQLRNHEGYMDFWLVQLDKIHTILAMEDLYGSEAIKKCKLEPLK